MSSSRSADYLVGLVREFCKLPRETGWVEFKENKAEPAEIGEYISALSNAAALAGKAFAYLIWGVENGTHEVVGTTVAPGSIRIGNEELESWLLHELVPKIQFCFFEVEVDGKHVVLLEIERAYRQPVQFRKHEYVRIGSYKKPLKEFAEKERELWRIFDRVPFEDGVAREHADDDVVLKCLDYPSYFELLGRALPEGRRGILTALAEDGLIRVCDASGWNVTNLGAVLFAKRLDDFPSLRRKAMRVIVYKGGGRIDTLKEHVVGKGYAAGFRGLISYISGIIPSNEAIGQALRKSVPMYPEIAVRELVANALIHQDFFVSGNGPMVEIFADRMEVTNPGRPLVSAERFVDTPPKSRNEGLASLMRRMGICEERGSGIDKVVHQTEFFQLPAPLFEVPDDSTRAVLFAHRPLTKMDKDDRIRACYLHACLRYVTREFLTNTSLRERFGLDQNNSATASRLIKEAVEVGAIFPVDEDAAKKLMKYVPWWAAGQLSRQVEVESSQ
jgi:ATP-dependent DNA helicase RecG